MNINLIASLAVLGAIALGGFLLSSYGKARYSAGLSDGTARCEKQVEAAYQAVKDADRMLKERADNEEKSLDDAGIDAGLRRLGIMRRDEDR